MAKEIETRWKKEKKKLTEREKETSKQKTCTAERGKGRTESYTEDDSSLWF